MKIYIDTDFKCFTSPDENRREFDVPFFDGKCQTFIEGYRYVPQDEEWTRADGVIFKGEMIAPFVNSAILEAVQKQYEADEAEKADMRQALNVLGVE